MASPWLGLQNIATARAYLVSLRIGQVMFFWFVTIMLTSLQQSTQRDISIVVVTKTGQSIKVVLLFLLDYLRLSSFFCTKSIDIGLLFQTMELYQVKGGLTTLCSGRFSAVWTTWCSIRLLTKPFQRRPAKSSIVAYKWMITNKNKTVPIIKIIYFCCFASTLKIFQNTLWSFRLQPRKVKWTNIASICN